MFTVTVGFLGTVLRVLTANGREEAANRVPPDPSEELEHGRSRQLC